MKVKFLKYFNFCLILTDPVTYSNTGIITEYFVE